MLNFENANEQLVGNIFDYIDDVEIYLKLLGYIPDTKHKYKSPFSTDNNPSFSFYQRETLLWKCFSSNKSGNAIGLVAEVCNLSYKEAIDHIYNKYPLRRNFIPFKREVSKPANIQVLLFEKVPSSFYKYWEDFHVSKETLDLYNIKPAKEVWLNNYLLTSYTDKNPVIRYLINGKYKIYQPYSKKNKWISNCRTIDVQGYKQLPATGDLLIISKAMKDICVWRELGFDAIALSSETANLSVDLVEEMRSRFKNVLCFLDNDNAGLETMNKYHELHQISFTYIPVELDCKDLAQFVSLYGLDGANELLDRLNIG